MRYDFTALRQDHFQLLICLTTGISTIQLHLPYDRRTQRDLNSSVLRQDYYWPDISAFRQEHPM